MIGHKDETGTRQEEKRVAADPGWGGGVGVRWRGGQGVGVEKKKTPYALCVVHEIERRDTGLAQQATKKLARGKKKCRPSSRGNGGSSERTEIRVKGGEKDGGEGRLTKFKKGEPRSNFAGEGQENNFKTGKGTKGGLFGGGGGRQRRRGMGDPKK